MTAPNRHRMALLTWAVVYPMITVLLVLLEPVLGGVATPVRTLLVTLIMVPAMVYVAMPFATSRLAGWLGRTAGPGGDGIAAFRSRCHSGPPTRVVPESRHKLSEISTRIEK